MASVRAHSWQTREGEAWSVCTECGMRGDDDRILSACPGAPTVGLTGGEQHSGVTVEIVDSPRLDEPETELSVKLKDTGKRDYYYQHPSGVACIDIIEHMPLNIGTAVKYLWRCDEKHPDPIEDLIKARWYLNREIKRRTKMLKESTNDDQTRS